MVLEHVGCRTMWGSKDVMRKRPQAIQWAMTSVSATKKHSFSVL